MSIEVADIFREALKRGELSTHAEGWKVVNDILKCRTEALGGHMYQCGDCGTEVPVYNSCRNRHCPKCQGEVSAKWLGERTKELLPVPYFHLVFTVPHELNGIFLQNKQLVFDILFRSAAKALRDVAKRRLGGTLGFFSVLHSWGKKMEFHPHIHTVVPGVILKPNGETEIAPDNYLLPKNVLSPVFRAIFIKSLVRAYRRGKLEFLGEQQPLSQPSAFFALIAELKAKHWICYAKKPFSGPACVLKYLARYTHRVAISERRIVALRDGKVTFTYKDYADGCKVKLLTLSVAEFVRRFLLHVLPRHFVRIRYSGFLSAAKRTKVIATLKARFNIVRQIELLPLQPKPCPCCGSAHLRHVRDLPRVRFSSNSHTTHVLSAVT